MSYHTPFPQRVAEGRPCMSFERNRVSALSVTGRQVEVGLPCSDGKQCSLEPDFRTCCTSSMAAQRIRVMREGELELYASRERSCRLDVLQRPVFAADIEGESVRIFRSDMSGAIAREVVGLGEPAVSFACSSVCAVELKAASPASAASRCGSRSAPRRGRRPVSLCVVLFPLPVSVSVVSQGHWVVYRETARGAEAGDGENQPEDGTKVSQTWRWHE